MRGKSGKMARGKRLRQITGIVSTAIAASAVARERREHQQRNRGVGGDPLPGASHRRPASIDQPRERTFATGFTANTAIATTGWQQTSSGSADR